MRPYPMFPLKSQLDWLHIRVTSFDAPSHVQKTLRSIASSRTSQKVSGTTHGSGRKASGSEKSCDKKFFLVRQF